MHTEYEDYLIWDFYTQVIPLLADMRKFMFLNRLEEYNERSIQYFDNIFVNVYGENKTFDTELAINLGARWFGFTKAKIPKFIELGHQFLENKRITAMNNDNSSKPEYFDLLIFLLGLNFGEGLISPSPIKNEESPLRSLALEIVDSLNTNTLKTDENRKFIPTLISYKWTGKEDDFVELQELLRDYIEPCSKENFRQAFTEFLLYDFSRIIWIRKANELIYFITRLIELELISDRGMNYTKLDLCFQLKFGTAFGDKWRFHKSKLGSMKQDNKTMLDNIVSKFL
jgi:hypothetical protein